jgi:hypothetical protein
VPGAACRGSGAPQGSGGTAGHRAVTICSEAVALRARPPDHWSMATGGGFVRRPDGSVVIALSLPHPGGEAGRLRVIVHAANRQRGLTRLRNLGFRAVHLRGNSAPPTPDEVSAVLYHPEGLVWRPVDAGPTDLWQPVSTLFRPARSH